MKNDNRVYCDIYGWVTPEANIRIEASQGINLNQQPYENTATTPLSNPFMVDMRTSFNMSKLELGVYND